MIGGFALVGWPAVYAFTGIGTFITESEQLGLRRNLVPTAGKAAAPVARFDPDGAWAAAE